MNTRIKELREKNGLSQQAFAELIGCKQQTLSRYETNKNDVPASVIVAAAKIFNVSTDYILLFSDNLEQEKKYEIIEKTTESIVD